MNIGLIGSRKRTRFVQKCTSHTSKKNYLFPAMLVLPNWQNIDVNISDFKKIPKLVRFYKIDMVVVGPEPLVNGIVDFLKEIMSKYLGQVNMRRNWKGQKLMKMICAKNNIPIKI